VLIDFIRLSRDRLSAGLGRKPRYGVGP